MQPIESVKINLTLVERISPWIYAVILLHVVVWTLAPTWVRYTLPMDAMEGTTWGHQLEWGYDKNPFMNAWLTAFATYIGGQSGWAIYLFSQLSVALCFWGIWQLGKNMGQPLYAFLAVLLLECIQYYNFHAIDFNDNVLELGFWTLTILFFYQALREPSWRDWLLTGLFAGVSMMTKYYSALLLLPMFLFMLCFSKTRMQFKKPYLYAGLGLFLLVIAPHTIWLFTHDFVTIQYAFNRVSSAPTWLNHLFFPTQFAWQQIEVFLPALILFSVLLFGRDRKQLSSMERISSYDYTFLIIVGLGPFLLTLLLSFCTGIKLRAGWGQPLLTFWGLLLLVSWAPVITPVRLKRFIILWIVIMAGLVISYCVALVRATEPSSANFPGQRIAQTVERQWHALYHLPMTYVVGPRWLAGNIAFYSKDQPTVYINADKKISPWVDEAKLKRQGAIFVWDPTEEYQMPLAEIKRRFAALGDVRVMHFTWLRNINMVPVEMTIAFLAPTSSA